MSWNKPDPETNAPHSHDSEKPDPVKSAPLPAGEKHEDVKDEALRHNADRPRDEKSGPIAGRPGRSEEDVDEALEETFPASDPPSFNRTTGAGSR
ncbi:MAG: hypothetical protein HLUCCO17_04845 [Saliniramus fredricksonii]|uniref:Uncharacterized protein n=1 Tax=Saliniramus fredricksonii TaxID=1653334 RepID=A0A0P7XW97_9HYPH|nr:hypothetical protein [Saliniramus fredricksonii]KPQ11808.1 MAG: hypothetical protein HLUCCO17_04845 [Saliniramus fredricksonii]SCC82267.1 hypothetical protein GA0071312_3248 [Saliniramus fredricksonii]